jgi:hypothetical protein
MKRVALANKTVKFTTAPCESFQLIQMIPFSHDLEILGEISPIALWGSCAYPVGLENPSFLSYLLDNQRK